MTNTKDSEKKDGGKLDKVLLFLRRIFVILFIMIIVRLLLFKVLKINKLFGNKTDSITSENTSTGDTSTENKDDLEKDDKLVNGQKIGNNYSLYNNKILYKNKEVLFADSDTFKVIDKKDVQKSIINSDNLLKIFADYNTRVSLMNNVDDIIENKENVTNELKGSSENGMWKMNVDYDQLSKYNRNDRYNMTPQQRAKFAIMFLYIKIIKKQNNDKATMEKALKELKIFLENFDEKNLEREVSDSKISNIKGDLAMDQDCLYLDGQLYACFLDGLF